MHDLMINLYMNGAVELSCILASLFVLYKVVSSIDSFVFNKVLIITHNSWNKTHAALDTQKNVLLSFLWWIASR